MLKLLGLTQFLQPLDVGVNKEIKQFMKAEDTNLRIKSNNMHPRSENEIIDIFCDVWYNKIKCESIINSFKKLVFLLNYKSKKTN